MSYLRDPAWQFVGVLLAILVPYVIFPEQFLSSGTNQRSDLYGGSVENCARFVVETLGAMAEVAGPRRVALRIAPEMGFNDIVDATPRETYRHLVERVAPMGLAYLHVTRFGGADYHTLLRPQFPGVYLQGGGFTTREAAQQAIDSGHADAIVFGTAFLANPDLVERLANGAPLKKTRPIAAPFMRAAPRGTRTIQCRKPSCPATNSLRQPSASPSSAAAPSRVRIP